MEKKAIVPQGGPEAKGPYSQAVAFGKLVFVSGQGPVDPQTGQIVDGDVLAEMRTAMQNVESILKESGSSLANVVKVTLYLADMDDFGRVNEVYKNYFKPPFPARTTIQAGRLPFDIKIEIDVIATT